MKNNKYIVTANELKKAVKIDLDLIKVIENAFVALAKDQVVMPPILSMDIKDQRGEVDVKTAYIKGLDGFAIKASPGFFNNPKIGLPSLNGLMILFDSKTGLVKSLLLDNGYLTAIRTAAAGAISLKYLANKEINSLGIIGTGEQARLQVQSALLVKKIKNIKIWGRDYLKAEICLKDIKNLTKINIQIEKSIETLVKSCDTIITTTPSTEYLVKADWVNEGTHILAIGSDQSEKNEIDPNIFKKVNCFIPDRLSQSKKLGELRSAIEKGIVNNFKDFVELGDIILDKNKGRKLEKDITLCDLTGTGVQDTAVATYALSIVKKNKLGKIIEN